MVRHNNQLPDNLPQLQNLIKRDPTSYKEEFVQQHNHYLSLLEVFRLNPSQENKSLDDLVMFIAQVCRNHTKLSFNNPINFIEFCTCNITKLLFFGLNFTGGTMLCRRVKNISTTISRFTEKSFNNT